MFVFIYSNNTDFNNELGIRLLYEFNGVNSVSQIIVEKILTTEEGSVVLESFKTKTVEDIQKNIKYLSDNKFLPKDIYGDLIPTGIFAIINKSEEQLFQYRIGSVSLDKFALSAVDTDPNCSRICVSVPHEDFVKYFNQI